MSFKLLVKVSRPFLVLLPPLIFLASFFYSGASLGLPSIIQLILLSFPFCVFLYGINDIYDYESDKLNKRKNALEGIKLGKKDHLFIKNSSFIVVLLLIISSLFTFNLFNILSMLLLIFVSYYYSAPPLRFKERPPLDLISVALAFLALIWLGYSFGGTLINIPHKAYFIPFLAIGMNAFCTIMDYSSDKKSRT